EEDDQADAHGRDEAPRSRRLVVLVMWCHRRRLSVAVRTAGDARGEPQRFFSASMSLGSTLCTSPTMPRSATEKIGASASLLTAMMLSLFFMPTRCCVAPEIP